ncbi:hypothetical protein C8F04DRAFT_1181546 [Mycena alexandri]|uniref:Uncharacterized protein n=1 Tax=Mycena alexandri TaxID=1745969 RepID=A0AAD6T0M6_9AGAR|nr:hypothetical protein C8F04DRAFT_1181546 [Mycena alexandri]
MESSDVGRGMETTFAAGCLGAGSERVRPKARYAAAAAAGHGRDPLASQRHAARDGQSRPLCSGGKGGRERHEGGNESSNSYEEALRKVDTGLMTAREQAPRRRPRTRTRMAFTSSSGPFNLTTAQFWLRLVQDDRTLISPQLFGSLSFNGFNLPSNDFKRLEPTFLWTTSSTGSASPNFNSFMPSMPSHRSTLPCPFRGNYARISWCVLALQRHRIGTTLLRSPRPPLSGPWLEFCAFTAHFRLPTMYFPYVLRILRAILISSRVAANFVRSQLTLFTDSRPT